jgi:serine/threonine protein kinase
VLLDALHHVHTRRGDSDAPLGFVHRDVTPSNILVTADGAVALIDFGLSTSAARSRLAPAPAAGTPGYVAPETFTQEPPDGRVDVFAAGAILYELTVGARAHPGNRLQAMHSTVEMPAPRPSAAVVGYPRALEEVVLTALARRPDERYASAEQMADHLTRAARAEGIVPSRETLAACVSRRLHGAAP